ncbi:MAG: heme ABC exporter ATP-binding protein CcmA [Pseudomonadota bacterium]
MSETPLIQGTQLGAVRGERVLFRDISVSARAGDLILLRGANGSGKTTLLRQLAGLSPPQAGQVARACAHHWIGHTNGLKAHETPRSHLDHWARVWGSQANIPAILKEMGLRKPSEVPSGMLSAGQKRRTALARLRLVERKLWLLDEPFNALDTDGQTQLAEMIKAHLADGGAVIATLHGHAPVESSHEVVIKP